MNQQQFRNFKYKNKAKAKAHPADPASPEGATPDNPIDLEHAPTHVASTSPSRVIPVKEEVSQASDVYEVQLSPHPSPPPTTVCVSPLFHIAESSLFNCTSLYSHVSLIVVAESLTPAVPPFSTLLVSFTHDVSGVLFSSLSYPRSLPLLIFSFLSFCSSRLCVFIYPAPSKLIYGSEGGIPSFPAKNNPWCVLYLTNQIDPIEV
jgi:hypothetical protein